MPPPRGDAGAPLKALIIDSWFGNYVGVVMLVRVVDGEIRPKDKLHFMATGANQLCEQVGVFAKSILREALRAGEVGFVIAGIQREIGRPKWATPSPTATARRRITAGLQGIKPQVSLASIRWKPTRYDSLQGSPGEGLKLNDASLQYRPEVSQALGFRFRCGFLGLLHMEIVQERLGRIRSGSDYHGAHRCVRGGATDGFHHHPGGKPLEVA